MVVPPVGAADLGRFGRRRLLLLLFGCCSGRFLQWYYADISCAGFLLVLFLRRDNRWKSRRCCRFCTRIRIGSFTDSSSSSINHYCRSRRSGASSERGGLRLLLFGCNCYSYWRWLRIGSDGSHGSSSMAAGGVLRRTIRSCHGIPVPRGNHLDRNHVLLMMIVIVLLLLLRVVIGVLHYGGGRLLGCCCCYCSSLVVLLTTIVADAAAFPRSTVAAVVIVVLLHRMAHDDAWLLTVRLQLLLMLLLLCCTMPRTRRRVRWKWSVARRRSVWMVKGCSGMRRHAWLLLLLRRVLLVVAVMMMMMIHGSVATVRVIVGRWWCHGAPRCFNLLALSLASFLKATRNGGSVSKSVHHNMLLIPRF